MTDGGAGDGLFRLIEPLDRIIRRASRDAGGRATEAEPPAADPSGPGRWEAVGRLSALLATDRACGDEMIEAVLDLLLRCAGADRALFVTLSPDGGLEAELGRAAAGRRLDARREEFSRSLVRQALDEHRIVFSAGPGAPAALCVPLEVRPSRAPLGAGVPERRRRAAAPDPRPLGALYADRAGGPLSPKGAEGAPAPLDLDLFAALANYATAAILHARLYEQATTDPLSRLHARSHFHRLLGEWARRASEAGLPLSLLLLDIDDFKALNDARGHLVGDEAIRRIGEVLRGSVRGIDACFRYGGDEFAVLLADTDAAGAAAAAGKIRAAVSEAVFGSPPARMTVSIGHATAPQDARDAQELVKRADQALYRAKAGGKDRVEAWTPEIGAAAKRADKLAGIVTGDFAADYNNVQALIDAIAAINASTDVSEMLILAVDKVIEATGAERGALMLAEGPRLATVVARDRARHDLTLVERFSRTIPERVLSTGESVCIVDVAEEAGGPSQSVADLALRTVMCVPLATRDRVIGVIYVDSRSRSGGLKESNLPFFEGLARQVAFAIENARLRARLALGGLGER